MRRGEEGASERARESEWTVTTSSLLPSTSAYVVRFVQFHCIVLFPRLVLPVYLRAHTHTPHTHTRARERVFTRISYIVRSPLFSGPATASTTRICAHTHIVGAGVFCGAAVATNVRRWCVRIILIHARIFYKSGMARKTTHV